MEQTKYMSERLSELVVKEIDFERDKNVDNQMGNLVSNISLAVDRIADEVDSIDRVQVKDESAFLLEILQRLESCNKLLSDAGTGIEPNTNISTLVVEKALDGMLSIVNIALIRDRTYKVIIANSRNHDLRNLVLELSAANKVIPILSLPVIYANEKKEIVVKLPIAYILESSDIYFFIRSNQDILAQYSFFKLAIENIAYKSDQEIYITIRNNISIPMSGQITAITMSDGSATNASIINAFQIGAGSTQIVASRYEYGNYCIWGGKNYISNQYPIGN